ncbi:MULTISPECIES: hypothetical protein [Vibrio harveyi group]|uniref:hypothetical protein n=1 Tax=Vibrio harveyi group TaxID=717610 RepID=UPI001110E03E|nr:hypothetical protein [Vibrio parahaemolyticus]MDG2761599.1 hypothetical protein [Vibrio parahaemolyticus]TMX40850.1 hypothetical protein DA098_03195 [Vibrio parahaemolyticus]TMX79845.1 hypothetical protein DA094_05005 [Vibrio parahaemolyticus]
MISEINKNLVGKVIYGIPTGNNRPRNKKEKIVKFNVLSVARKYMTLVRVGSSDCTADKYNIKGATQSAINSGYGGNAGYMFFDSLANLEQHKKAALERTFLRETFGGFGTPFSDDVIIRIAEVVRSYIDE